MAIGTPFHPRTDELCKSRDWRQWSGYFSASSYDDFVQPEYAAIRHAAALIDVSPLYKYRIDGPDAAALVNRVFTYDFDKVVVGRVVYTPWCDSDGRVRQEGTVFRLDDDVFRVCAAEPAIHWLRRNAVGLDVEVADRAKEIAALSLQGPRSREVLRHCSSADVDDLKFFRMADGEIAGVPVTVSRTGYTGDLGYEIWIPADRALRVWDALMEGGKPWHILPAGMLAMDISRVEAGFVLINVDYVSSEVARIDEHEATPYELGLGWAVKLDKGPFIGRAALAAEAERGPRRRVVGLAIDWEPLEQLYLEADLMPDLPLVACREPVPVYSREDGRQIGRATTRVWSTLLKKYIAIATLDVPYDEPGTEVGMEVTVSFARKRAPARVQSLPFFRPERARA